ncbi:hypothetical protein OC498_10480 [Acinetobacter bohemicus]|uniref:hypothetical protein n=1 Tax=Acinetobacter TaxID=469 RepID=UPI00157C97F3|nr:MULTISPECIES: hypothetical protein [Acinetobacter]MCO8042990.1 hypothetical protein [Acinetobacter sp. S4400-12]MCU7225322.1 hypothetical protein [Acinetobacter bohemicus]MDM1781384.1 hypothetical protein [Acinetobacter indicus]QKQ69628.1 hypothetical protein E5Y90_04985 [Acinetobacter sp. 10FS3-1]
MLMFKTRALLTVSLISSVLLLQACGNDHQSPEQAQIKPAPKLTNDATTYANAAWKLINEVDPLVYNRQLDQLEKQVREPARKLSTDWRINVKMTDSVTEGKYALCRKALTSLEIWARTTLENGSSVAQKQADYGRDKKQCENAIANPALGNTDPKQKGTAIAEMQ